MSFKHKKTNNMTKIVVTEFIFINTIKLMSKKNTLNIIYQEYFLNIEKYKFYK